MYSPCLPHKKLYALSDALPTIAGHADAIFRPIGLTKWCYSVMANKRTDRATLEDLWRNPDIKVRHQTEGIVWRWGHFWFADTLEVMSKAGV